MDPRHHLDCVQAKVTLTGSRAAARRALILPTTSGARRHVFFCVDPVATEECDGIAPFDDGIILRIRQYGGFERDRDDSTVKLRPARRSRLSPEWLGTHRRGGETFRLEADWAGERRACAAWPSRRRPTRRRIGCSPACWRGPDTRRWPRRDHPPGPPGSAGRVPGPVRARGHGRGQDVVRNAEPVTVVMLTKFPEVTLKVARTSSTSPSSAFHGPGTCSRSCSLTVCEVCPFVIGR